MRRWKHSTPAVLVAMTLTLTACGGQPRATEEPDPASWFVGEEDRTTPAPPPEREVTLVVTDSAFIPSTVVVRRGQPLRIENTGAETHTFTVDDGDIDVLMEPGETDVESIDLNPGRYPFVSRDDASISGTLIVK